VANGIRRRDDGTGMKSEAAFSAVPEIAFQSFSDHHKRQLVPGDGILPEKPHFQAFFAGVVVGGEQRAAEHEIDLVDKGQVEQGKGLAGSLFYDEGLQGDVLSSTTNLRQITEQTMQLLAQTQGLLKKVEAQVDEIPEITDKVKPLLYEADRTIRATQRIWPLSSSMPEQDTQTLTSPEATE